MVDYCCSGDANTDCWMIKRPNWKNNNCCNKVCYGHFYDLEVCSLLRMHTSIVIPMGLVASVVVATLVELSSDR